MKTNKNKVIEFPTSSAFHNFLDELKKAYDENRLQNFICIYNYEYEKGKEKEGFLYGIDNYWFGEKSCLGLLGLTDVMKDEISSYMRRKAEEANECSTP